MSNVIVLNAIMSSSESEDDGLFRAQMHEDSEDEISTVYSSDRDEDEPNEPDREATPVEGSSPVDEENDDEYNPPSPLSPWSETGYDTTTVLSSPMEISSDDEGDLATDEGGQDTSVVFMGEAPRPDDPAPNSPEEDEPQSSQSLRMDEDTPPPVDEDPPSPDQPRDENPPEEDQTQTDEPIEDGQTNDASRKREREEDEDESVHKFPVFPVVHHVVSDQQSLMDEYIEFDNGVIEDTRDIFGLVMCRYSPGVPEGQFYHQEYNAADRRHVMDFYDTLAIQCGQPAPNMYINKLKDREVFCVDVDTSLQYARCNRLEALVRMTKHHIVHQLFGDARVPHDIRLLENDDDNSGSVVTFDFIPRHEAVESEAKFLFPVFFSDKSQIKGKDQATKERKQLRNGFIDFCNNVIRYVSDHGYSAPNMGWLREVANGKFSSIPFDVRARKATSLRNEIERGITNLDKLLQDKARAKGRKTYSTKDKEGKLKRLVQLIEKWHEEIVFLDPSNQKKHKEEAMEYLKTVREKANAYEPTKGEYPSVLDHTRPRESVHAPLHHLPSAAGSALQGLATAAAAIDLSDNYSSTKGKGKAKSTTQRDRYDAIITNLITTRDMNTVADVREVLRRINDYRVDVMTYGGMSDRDLHERVDTYMNLINEYQTGEGREITRELIDQVKRNWYSPTNT